MNDEGNLPQDEPQGSDQAPAEAAQSPAPSDQPSSVPAEAGPKTDEVAPDAPADALAPATDEPACSAQADLPATVEAILFSADKPLPASRVSEICEAGGVKVVREVIAALNEKYEQMGCSFRITEIAGGFQMQTLPEYADVLARLMKNRNDAKLSQAALETMAVIAYRQPVLRADIEAIRGVACGEVLRSLMERSLVRIVGRAEEIGRPLLYGTTKYFLEVFGLANLEDLPNVEQLRKAAYPKPPAAAGPAPAPQADAAGQSAPTPQDAAVQPAEATNTQPSAVAAENAQEPAAPQESDPAQGQYVSDRPESPDGDEQPQN